MLHVRSIAVKGSKQSDPAAACLNNKRLESRVRGMPHSLHRCRLKATSAGGREASDNLKTVEVLLPNAENVCKRIACWPLWLFKAIALRTLGVQVGVAEYPRLYP